MFCDKASSQYIQRGERHTNHLRERVEWHVVVEISGSASAAYEQSVKLPATGWKSGIRFPV